MKTATLRLRGETVGKKNTIIFDLFLAIGIGCTLAAALVSAGFILLEMIR